MATYQELMAQKEALEKQIIEVKAREKAEGVAKAMAIIEQYKLTAADIFARKGMAGSPGGKVAAKYRNPATGETWTGRGKAPKWIEGQDRSRFTI
jgi:DNA-binding protein H-NS